MGFGAPTSLLSMAANQTAVARAGMGRGGGSAPASGGGMGFGFGDAMAIGGMALTAVGAFYAADATKYSLRSRALDLQFASTQAALSARVAERDASDLLEAGRQQGAFTALRYEQTKSSQRTRTAAAGLVAGVGSAAEEAASIELARDIDLLTIEENAMRASAQARMRGVNLRNRAAIARADAISAHEMSTTVNPYLAAATSLIGGASQVGSSFLNRAGR